MMFSYIITSFFYCVAQTEDLLPSGSDFITSGDESGGTKAQRRRVNKDKPKKSRMKRELQNGDGDADTVLPGSSIHSEKQQLL